MDDGTAHARVAEYPGNMRRFLLLMLIPLASCDHPGTPAGGIFGGSDDDNPDEAAMIADLEAADPDPGLAPRMLAPVPSMAQDTWIQVFDRSSRICHRVHGDGRYTIQVGDGAAQQMPVLSREEPERRLLSDTARERLASAVHDVRFHTLSPHLPPVDAHPTTGIPTTDVRPLAFSVRDDGSGRVHTVEVKADLTMPESFGALAPLWTTLDDAVFGRWLEQALAR